MENICDGKIKTLYWRLYLNNIKSLQTFPLFTERRPAGQKKELSPILLDEMKSVTYSENKTSPLACHLFFLLFILLVLS